MKFFGKIETVIVVIFGVLFLLWTASKCCSTQEKYVKKDIVEEVDTNTTKQLEEEALVLKPLPPKEVVSNITTSTDEQIGTMLYVQIEGLNVRSGPGLDSLTVAQLKLNEKIFFMNEKTDFKQQIHMNGVDKYEPWIKVRTRTGKVGWVYAGGVHYYKKE